MPNQLLNDKPHQGGDKRLMRSRSDVTRMHPSIDPIEEKKIVSDFNSSFPNRICNKTPVKMLIAQEMAMDFDSIRDPPNVIAKLMGIDILPQREPPGLTTQRSHSRIHPQNDYIHDIDPNEYKDLHVKWKQPHKYDDHKSDGNMSLVRQKFTEAKRLSMDEKLRQSKQFQDALDVLSSNRDLFLKCLQEPNPMFPQHHHDPPETRRITVLRPSNVANSSGFPGTRCRDEKQIKKGIFPLMNNLEKAHQGNSPHPTRIVVLKPGPRKLHDAEAVAPLQSRLPQMLLSEDFFGDTEDDECRESRKLAKSITRQMRERFGDHYQGETLVPSIFSANGYAGDESSFDKSEIESKESNPSDLEATSPISRDYADGLGSPLSSPVFTRASYSPESSVCREAKKRLSERWAMIVSDGSCPEKRQFQRSSSTLGEMLSLLETKREDPQREGKNDFELFVGEQKREENVDCSPRNLTRSKSVPVSSSVFGTRLYPDNPGSNKRKPESPREDVKETSLVSSFRGKVSSLFFPRNKKTGKNYSPISGTKDEAHSFTGEICSDNTESPSEKGTNVYSPQPNSAGKQGIISPETVSPVAEHIPSANLGEKHNQPSPISVLDPPLEETEPTANPRDQQGVENLLNCIGPSLIDKSPPIGSIARTLSWEDSCLNTTTPLISDHKPFTSIRKTDERDCFSLVKSLLSAAFLHQGRVLPSPSFLAKWHSAESPLDPSLRQNYIDDLNDASPDPNQQHYASSSRELVFDCINEVLMDIAGREFGSCQKLSLANGDIAEEVWARMKAWFRGAEEEEEDGCGAHYSRAVDTMVGTEVAGEGWSSNFRLEVENLWKVMGEVLLEELVEESVVEFTGMPF